jgi:hypothetical protein
VFVRFGTLVSTRRHARIILHHPTQKTLVVIVIAAIITTDAVSLFGIALEIALVPSVIVVVGGADALSVVGDTNV